VLYPVSTAAPPSFFTPARPRGAKQHTSGRSECLGSERQSNYVWCGRVGDENDDGGGAEEE
jgi:hypothetical protein